MRKKSSVQSRVRRRLALALCALAGSAAAPGLVNPAHAAAAAPRPFGHTCTAEPYGVRFCPTASLSQRVPSWDGAPLDVDVTLPATGDGPFPTIVMLHGYGSDKTMFESTDPTAPYTNAWFAHHGYAVVNLTARGAGNSCGSAQSRAGTPACNPVVFELADQRYDARDVQYLLGLLVDEGIADPGRLGVTGQSLGSIVTLELAVLNDRVRLLDGGFAPWVSPKGVPLHIAAADALVAIADTTDVVAPNGRFLDFEPDSATSDRSPVGVFKASFPLAAAAASVPVAGYYSPPTASFSVDRYVAVCEASGPGDPGCDSDIQAFGQWHQPIGMPIGPTPAPIMMEDGWEDSLANGASQAIRLADWLSQVAPAAKVSLLLADAGHPISANKAADVALVLNSPMPFFDYYLEHQGTPPAPGSVTAYTASCPITAPSAGPYTADGWRALAPGAVRFGSAAPQTVFGAGDPTIAAATDTMVNGEALFTEDHCVTFPATDYPGTAVYTQPVKQTFTMLGLPTLRMDVARSGSGDGQIDARLWDVAPGGQETLVSLGTYALTPGQHGTITWQLFGGGWTFAAGHTIRLELLGSDPPYLRPSKTQTTLTVSATTVELPTHEAPDGGQIVTPLLDGGH